MFFFGIPLFAVALKIVYWRAQRDYVEHLVYSIHFHVFLLIFLVVGFLAFIYLLGGELVIIQFIYRPLLFFSHFILFNGAVKFAYEPMAWLARASA